MAVPKIFEKEMRQPLLLKPPEAAAMLAISPRKLWELTDSGEIPCIRIGRAGRYSLEDLRKWVHSQQSAENSS